MSMSVCLSVGLQKDRVVPGDAQSAPEHPEAAGRTQELEASRDLNQTLGIHGGIKHPPESCPAD